MVQCLSIIQCTLLPSCDFSFNNEQVYTSNGLYAHKIFISNFFSTNGTKNSIFACQGCRYEKETTSFADEPLLSENEEERSHPLVFSLAINSYAPTSKSGYVLFAPGETSALSRFRTRISHLFFEASLFTRQNAIKDRNFNDFHSSLQLHPARYNCEVLAKTFVIPNGQNHINNENIYNAPMR